MMSWLIVLFGICVLSLQVCDCEGTIPLWGNGARPMGMAAGRPLMPQPVVSEMHGKGFFGTRPYPYPFIDGPYRPSDYNVFDKLVNRDIPLFRPGTFTMFYPFDLKPGWYVVDPILLGVQPAVFPDIPDVIYSGYYYACPNSIDLYNPIYWESDPFTKYCQYFWY